MVSPRPQGYPRVDNKIICTSIFLSAAMSTAFFPPFGSPAWVLFVPQDVFQLILSWASPLDVLNLRGTCRAFCRIIDGGQSKNIWRLAFRNVLFSPPFGSAYMPSQIAALAFKGGECYACKKQTLAVPESFSLNVRFCSLFCKQYSTLARDVAHYQTLPFVMPYLEGTRDRPLYRPCDAQAAWRAFSENARTSSSVLLPAITPEHHIQDPELDAWMLTAEDLCNSADRYKAKKEGIDRVNYTILEDIAAGIHLSVTQLVSRSPTLARHVNIFSMDLEILDVDVLERIRPLVLVELAQRGSFENDVLPCCFCPDMRHQRLYREYGLNLHISQRHPEQVAEPARRG
ncbi:hypothetical protein R3P38DRAFT_1852454 [Favolaschia claudopus]|uniref:F-box domain-containing protein n=1 Tax=Favolaschia claudopus TaxID=2862362 RepID=A0AAW0D9W6_9AGAR